MTVAFDWRRLLLGAHSPYISRTLTRAARPRRSTARARRTKTGDSAARTPADASDRLRRLRLSRLSTQGFRRYSDVATLPHGAQVTNITLGLHPHRRCSALRAANPGPGLVPAHIGGKPVCVQ